jgi:hypothetical protein
VLTNDTVIVSLFSWISFLFRAKGVRGGAAQAAPELTSRFLDEAFERQSVIDAILRSQCKPTPRKHFHKSISRYCIQEAAHTDSTGLFYLCVQTPRPTRTWGMLFPSTCPSGRGKRASPLLFRRHPPRVSADTAGHQTSAMFEAVVQDNGLQPRPLKKHLTRGGGKSNGYRPVHTISVRSYSHSLV